MRKKWNEKSYYSFDYYLKERFHEKVYKVSLNAGLTCPNRDGTIGNNGCIFCSEGGSGDFAASSALSITNQITMGIKLVSKKYTGSKFIAYFQAYTNTYGPVDYLRKIFYEAIENENIVALSIATRPDCLSDEILELLDGLNKIKPVFVELGLQTIHEKTSIYIRRGYPLSTFEKAVNDLHLLGIETIVHTILGLPFEGRKEVLSTIGYLAKLPVSGIKLQLLHVLKNTDLLIDYESKKFDTLSFEEYCNLVVDCIERLPENIVIHRLTGDAPKNLLVAPMWSSDKRRCLNRINQLFKERETWQGKLI
ncbi:hypothetical protein SAMN05216249_10853 [Acetitomaculum ruminis DSM 5522]|uniref:Radical SAM core domain-containing protein n=1 Tax=Acetitomaculum ruminis DSM 5522 TaxID=1120918 RepID=A0A1I0Y151_9FIRM|nr:TIGR01212 family radical SAM protein [Acetitomaculum ruminis]SFB06607.1 hypothetical protein SAMN05216249_10853 [Acetitomaculum ruminis DSM 5522]